MQLNMSRATLSTERRKKQRKRPLGLVYVELSAANGGMLRDLSEQGFAMRSMRLCKLETQLHLLFRWIRKRGWKGSAKFRGSRKMAAWLDLNLRKSPRPCLKKFASGFLIIRMARRRKLLHPRRPTAKHRHYKSCARRFAPSRPGYMTISR